MFRKMLLVSAVIALAVTPVMAGPSRGHHTSTGAATTASLGAGFANRGNPLAGGVGISASISKGTATAGGSYKSFGFAATDPNSPIGNVSVVGGGASGSTYTSAGR